MNHLGRALLALSALAAPLMGQDVPDPVKPLDLPTVVVEARKWAEALQDVPSSVSVTDREELESSGAETVRDAAWRVPNLHWTEFSSRRLSFPWVRGVGSGQGEPAVVTNIDGVPQLAVSSTNLSLLDVERVEFLRGPQGTLYGRNALGGALNVVSRDPTWHREGEVKASFGSHDHQDVALTWSSPLSEDLAFRVAASRTSRDGFTKNQFTGNDVDDRRSLFGRTRLLWAPSERSEVRVSLYGERSRDGGFVLSNVAGLKTMPHRINQDFEGSVERDVLSPSVVWNWYGDTVEFTSLTSFNDWDIEETADFDFSFIDGVRRFTQEEQQSVMQEFRLASAEDAPVDLGDDMSLRWLVGLFAFHADAEQSASNEFRPAGAGILFPITSVGTSTAAGDLTDQAYALYSQATVQRGPLELTAGLRFDREEREADLENAFLVGGFPVFSARMSEDKDVDQFVPHLALGWHVTPEQLTYLSFSRGFKAGGFNLTAPVGRQAFGPEKNWTYEAGWKSRWFQDRLIVNLAGFWIEWDDMQLSLFDAATGGYVDNAGDSSSKGLELEVMGRPWEPLTVFGSAGVLCTEFDRYTDPYGVDVSGNDLPFAPESTLALGGQWEGHTPQGHTWYVRGEYQAVGDFYYDAGNLADESFDLVNLRLGYRGEGWSLELWVRNAFDDEYVPVAFQPDPTNPATFVGESGAPRVAGITASLTF